MKSTRINIMMTGVALWSAVFLVACAPGEPPAEEPVAEEQSSNTVVFNDAQYKSAGLEVGGVERRQISGQVSVSGQLDVPPQQKVSVSVPIGGFLKETPLLQGSRVKKGDVIAVVENIEFIQLQQDYLEAKSQFEFAEKDYARQVELAREDVAAAKVLQQSKTNFEGWRAKLGALDARLRMLHINVAELNERTFTSTIRIYAPINGYVTRVNVNIGKFINPTDVLFEIVDTEHLHVELVVFEKDIRKLKIGQKVRFVLANEQEERLATVYLLGREIEADRTVRIHCHIDKEDNGLLPGMYLKANVETGGAEVPALPDAAIVGFQGRDFVFTVLGADSAGTSFGMIAVQAGSRQGGYTEVALPPEIDPATAKFVVRNAYAILAKMKNTEAEE